MKPIKKYYRKAFAAASLTLAMAPAVFAQTNLQFIAITQTPEHAIQLTWASISNEVYEIDEAEALGTNADGSTTWNELYTQYPSQGTNTFWLDTGNYFDVPPIVKPEYSPARFYRITDLGPDTTSDEPVISIISPTNGFVASNTLTITVSASSDQVTLYTKLYVDGQEMNMAIATTNDVENGTNNITDTYVINTCEWLNGQHILFATATCESGLEGPADSPALLVGHAVSPFVPVTFDNLITGVSFSQAFFDPTDGQTQLVAAIFATNVNWTLEIQDVNSNTVLTTNGSGISMQFNWDGNGSGETNLPPGVYTYLLAAQANGSSGGTGSGGGGGSGGGPPSPDDSSDDSLNTIEFTADGRQFLTFPLPPSPPGLSYGTNAEGNQITNMTIELPLPQAQSSAGSQGTPSSRTFSPDNGSGGEGTLPPTPPPPAASQQTRAPTRPPTAPVRGTVGTFGIGYQTYGANGTNGYTLYAPDNGLGIGQRIQLQGLGGDTPLTYDALPHTANLANGFAANMKNGAWNSSFLLVDNQITISSLTGGGNPFNQVNLGLLMLHGTYGTSEDYSVHCKQMYFPITSGTTAQYIRMSAMNFGGSGSNGLKWMAIFACFSLNHTDWNSMQNQNIIPYNSGLHLLLGCDTVCYDCHNLLGTWAVYMNYGVNVGEAPLTIQNAWFQAAHDAYQKSQINYGTTMKFAVAGDTACFGDTLQTNSTPMGTWTYNSQQVWPP